LGIVLSSWLLLRISIIMQEATNRRLLTLLLLHRTNSGIAARARIAGVNHDLINPVIVSSSPVIVSSSPAIVSFSLAIVYSTRQSPLKSRQSRLKSRQSRLKMRQLRDSTRHFCLFDLWCWYVCYLGASRGFPTQSLSRPDLNSDPFADSESPPDQ
jgi:hypothetical protein